MKRFDGAAMYGEEREMVEGREVLVFGDVGKTKKTTHTSSSIAPMVNPEREEKYCISDKDGGL